MSDEQQKAVFASNLLRLMAENGKSRNDVSDATGIKYATLCEWINERKFPRIDKIQILADYFGVKKSELIEKRKNEDEVEIHTIAAHAMRDLTEEEAEEVLQFAKYIKSKRNKK